MGRVHEAQTPDVPLYLMGDDSDLLDSGSMDDTEDEDDRRRIEMLQEDYLEESYNRYMQQKVGTTSIVQHCLALFLVDMFMSSFCE